MAAFGTYFVLFSLLILNFANARYLSKRQLNNEVADYMKQECEKKPDMTACLGDVSTPGSLPDEDEKTIVDFHNKLRGNPTAFGLPPAKNMRKVKYSHKAAWFAQKHADECIYEHDTNKQRLLPDGFGYGQNMAKSWGYPNPNPPIDWVKIIMSWFNEYKNFTMGGPMRGTTGHFTQLMWADSALIGCGVKKCSVGNIYVCNYGPAGNVNAPQLGKSQKNPYKTGDQASDCPDYADQGLCDCGDLACLSMGEFDVKTCSCDCKFNRDNAKQPNCAVDCSKAADNQMFGCSKMTPTSKDCSPNSNVRYQFCPVACGMCPKGSGPAKKPKQPCNGYNKCKFESVCVEVGQTVHQNGMTCSCVQEGMQIKGTCMFGSPEEKPDLNKPDQNPQPNKNKQHEDSQPYQTPSESPSSPFDSPDDFDLSSLFPEAGSRGCPIGQCEKKEPGKPTLCVAPGKQKITKQPIGDFEVDEVCSCKVHKSSNMMIMSMECRSQFSSFGKRDQENSNKEMVTFESYRQV